MFEYFVVYSAFIYFSYFSFFYCLHNFMKFARESQMVLLFCNARNMKFKLGI